MGANGCDIVQVHRPSVEHAHHQPGDVFAAAEKRAGLYRHFRVVVDERARMRDGVVCRQGLPQVVERHAETGDALRIEFDMHNLARAAYRVDIPGSRDALYFRFERVRDFQQVLGSARRIFRPQRRRDDRHIVNALGFHDGRQDAEILRAPVLVREDSVIEPDQCLGAWFADLELHGEDAHAGA